MIKELMALVLIFALILLSLWGYMEINSLNSRLFPLIEEAGSYARKGSSLAAGERLNTAREEYLKAKPLLSLYMGNSLLEETEAAFYSALKALSTPEEAEAELAVLKARLISMAELQRPAPGSIFTFYPCRLRALTAHP